MSAPSDAPCIASTLHGRGARAGERARYVSERPEREPTQRSAQPFTAASVRALMTGQRGWKMLTPLVLCAGAILGGCSSTPEREHPQLEVARAAYHSAQRDAEVVENAPEELDKAARALETAEQLWRENAAPDEVDHYVYLARQRVAIARQAARLESARRDLEQAAAQRDKLAPLVHAPTAAPSPEEAGR